MSDFLKSPFGQKLIGTLAGAGLLWLAHKFPDLSAELGVLAGGLGIGVHALHAEPPKFGKIDEGAQ